MLYSIDDFKYFQALKINLLQMYTCQIFILSHAHSILVFFTLGIPLTPFVILIVFMKILTLTFSQKLQREELDVILDMFLLSPCVLQYTWLFGKKKNRLMITKKCQVISSDVKASKRKSSVTTKILTTAGAARTLIREHSKFI